MNVVNRQRKFTFRLVFGILSAGTTGVFLLVTMLEISTSRMLDYPCGMGRGPRPTVNEDTQIAYCLSLWPRPPSSGGGVYALGSTEDKRVVIGPSSGLVGQLTLEKQGQILIVNNQQLQPGQSYDDFRWRLSLNPWLLTTARIVVTNTGFASSNEGALGPALIASGDIHEGLLPNPLGPMLLVLGIWLMKATPA